MHIKPCMEFSVLTTYVYYPLPANSQGHQAYIDWATDTSTLTANKSEVMILKQNTDQQQHNPEDAYDAKEEQIIGLPTQQKTVMETFPPPNIKR